MEFDARWERDADPDEDPDGDARLASWQARHGYPLSTAPGYINVPRIHRDHVDEFDRENDEYRKAHWTQRQQARGQMQAMQRKRRDMQADAQQSLGIQLARSYAPGVTDMEGRYPRHGTNAFDPFDGSEVQRMLEGSGLLSYPGEGLIKEGMDYVSDTIHNI